MKEISIKHSIEILEKMFSVVGDKYDESITQNSDWFLLHSWTKEEQDEFVIWLAKFLLKNKYVMKGTYKGQNMAEYEAKKIVANYGWKLR